MAMMALGVFVFTRSTIPFQNFDRSSSWSHPTNPVVGGIPKAQFVGRESETVSINGVLMPEITGGSVSIKLLEFMAEQGQSWPLIDGSTFEVIGFFVIEKLSENRRFMNEDGSARKIEFSLELKRTNDSMLVAITDKVLSFL